MSSEWQTKPLEEVAASDCSLSYGIVQPGDALDNGLPVVRPTDLKTKVVELSDLKRIDPERATGYQRTTLRGGDLLVCVRGSTGSVSIACPELSGANVTRGIVPIRFNKTILDDSFGYYLMVAEQVQCQIREKTYGAALMQINIRDLRRILLSFPPLPEQKRIVGLLDEAFADLATAKAKAEKNLQNARALFESHLQSVFTQRGKGWTEKSVEELVSEGTIAKPFDGNHGEIHPKKSDYTESGVPFIMARDLKDGLVDTGNCIFISRKLADSLRVGFAKDGDVLISHKGTIGRSANLHTKSDYIMLTPQVTSYRVKDSTKLFNRFIRFYFMSPLFQRAMIAGAADGSTRAYIGITKQLTLRIRFPSLSEQKRISAKLDSLVAETQRLASIYERKLAALEELKKSLLHQAFTGAL